ncbi:13927_t:CDS:2 [Cetraspora pellucida]|uniref:13927_t:CDS:1 n=1 Tax=Cetraspora pellucida TaxID=1433469 RepID=A0A9N8VTM9_9GLOM|nr:13927_t:CDS:2 [Cetraspora pellucida]
MSSNVKFDIKLLLKHWYTDPMQASKYSIIRDTATAEFNINEKYAYSFGIAKSELKFALKNELVNEFVEIIVKFIEDYTKINTNKQMMINISQIENSKKLKHKDKM